MKGWAALHGKLVGNSPQKNSPKLNYPSALVGGLINLEYWGLIRMLLAREGYPPSYTKQHGHDLTVVIPDMAVHSQL